MASDSTQRPTEVDADDQITIANNEHHAPDETSPLLPRHESASDDQASTTKGSRWRWPSLIALLLLIIGGILILVLVFIAPNIVKEYAEQAAVFEPQSVSIDSFTATGVRARIRGSFRLDSTRVEQDSVRNLGRFFTSIVSEVESGESSVEVVLPEYGNIVIGTAKVPPVVVSVRDRKWKYIDVLAELEPGNVDGLRTIANDYIDGRLGDLRVIGKARVPLKSGIFSIGTQDILHEIVLGHGDVPEMPKYTLEHLAVREVDVPAKHDQAVIADAVLTVSNDYPVEFTVPPLAFNLLVDACKSSDPAIQVADAVTHEITVRPKESLTVRVTAAMRQLPPSLVEDCPNSGKSPLDRLVGRYLKGNDSTVYIRGSSSPPPIQNPDAPTAPSWISALLASLIVPVPVPGHAFNDKLIRNFSLTDTHFGLPDPWAAPDTPESKPQISANVRALIALPEQVEFGLAVAHVRATADVFYNGTKFGELDLHKWQPANSSRYDGPPPAPKPGQDPNDNSTLMLIQSHIDDAPLTITDEDGFTDVIQRLIFGKQAIMHISALIDVEVKTPIGPIVVRDVPAQGEIPVKLEIPGLPTPSPDPDGNRTNATVPPFNTSILAPRVVDLRVQDSTRDSLFLTTILDLTNPSEYSASIPFINVQIWSNGSQLGYVQANHTTVGTGRNKRREVSVGFAPLAVGGHQGKKAADEGRRLMGKFVSGEKDLVIGVRAWEGSFLPEEMRAPGNKSMCGALGRVLARLGEFVIPVPPIGLRIPGGDDDDDDDDEDPPTDGGGDEDEDEDGPHFMKDAIFHLFSSTATFTLMNPLPHDAITITSINATALYPHPVPRDDPDDGDDPDDDPWLLVSRGDGDEPPLVLDPVGHIFYDLPMTIPPLAQTPDGNGWPTPKLPVNWRLGSVGYEAVRKALGGKLKLGTTATVDVKIGHFEQKGVLFEKKSGIGASVRL